MHAVTYVGDNNETQHAISFGPDDEAVADLLVVDNDNGSTSWKRDVPRREYPSDDGNGHTFH